MADNHYEQEISIFLLIRRHFCSRFPSPLALMEAAVRRFRFNALAKRSTPCYANDNRGGDVIAFKGRSAAD